MAIGRSGLRCVEPPASILVLIAHNPEEIVQWHHAAFHRLPTCLRIEFGSRFRVYALRLASASSGHIVISYMKS